MPRRTRVAQTAIKVKPPKGTIEGKLRKLVQSASIIGRHCLREAHAVVVVRQVPCHERLFVQDQKLIPVFGVKALVLTTRRPPQGRPVQSHGVFYRLPHFGGLHHSFVRM